MRLAICYLWVSLSFFAAADMRASSRSGYTLRQIKHKLTSNPIKSRRLGEIFCRGVFKYILNCVAEIYIIFKVKLSCL
jgi:hypothetical protein